MSGDGSEWVDTKVQVQGDSLVVKDAVSGDCLVTDVVNLFEHYDPYENPNEPFDRLESIFGEEVFAYRETE